MDEIKTTIAKEQIEVADKILELSAYFKDEGEAKLDFGDEYSSKADSCADEAKAQAYVTIAELSTLEADEDLKLSILLSAKAKKILGEARAIMEDSQ